MNERMDKALTAAAAAVAPPRRAFGGVSRWRAAAIHLGGSAILGLAALAMMRLVWYPDEYFRLGGAGTLILLLVGVDIVLGPLCTLIVFRPGKPGLGLDLSVIVTVQVAALLYGTTVTFLARPVYLVHVVDQFKVVSAASLTPELRAEARFPEFRSLPLLGPRLAGALVPTDPEERNRAVLAAASGVDLDELPRYWVPYDEVRKQALARATPLMELKQRFPENGSVIDGALARLGRSEKEIVGVGVRARFGEALMLVDAETAEPITMIDARW